MARKHHPDVKKNKRGRKKKILLIKRKHDFYIPLKICINNYIELLGTLKYTIFKIYSFSDYLRSCNF